MIPTQIRADPMAALREIQQMVYSALRAAPMQLTLMAMDGKTTDAVSVLVVLQETLDCILEVHGIEPLTAEALEDGQGYSGKVEY